jgi:hypothetical protein
MQPQLSDRPETSHCTSAGRIRLHTFRRDPTFPRALVGYAGEDWEDSFQMFSSQYNTNLDLVQNDCKTFTIALAQHLTGIAQLDLATLPLKRRETTTQAMGSSEQGSSMPDLLDWQ